MELQSKDTALLFKVTHSKPIEMSDFVATMNSLECLFESYVKEHADSKQGKRARLYVEKIQHGSIEVFLTESVLATALPFIENFNSIVEFAGFLKTIVGNAIQGRKELKLSLSELKSLHDLFSIPANDPDGKVSFMAFDKSDVNISFNNCTFNFGESNAAQNQICKAIDSIKEENSSETIHPRKVLTIHQMRSDMGTNAGNRGLIEELNSKPLPIVFETDDLKTRILHSSENPTLQAYFVDVVMQVSSGKPIAYKIVALHDIIPLED
jgi:hypothetical protein